MSIGTIMRVERAKRNWTQDDLAEKCGVIRQTISNIECGITKPSVPVAKKIAENLGLDWTIFFEE